MLCADLVKVRWKDESGKGHRCTAILEDISVHGACLQFDEPIAVDTVLKIRHPRGEMHGTVKYCVFREIGYFVGLQFAEDSVWSKQSFQPQHLLDLHRLLSKAIKRASRESSSAELGAMDVAEVELSGNGMPKETIH